MEKQIFNKNGLARLFHRALQFLQIIITSLMKVIHLLFLYLHEDQWHRSLFNAVGKFQNFASSISIIGP